MRLISMVVLALLLAPRASACSCLPAPLPKEELAGSDMAFVGKVVGSAFDGAGGYYVGRRFEFRVRKGWKGSPDQVVTVHTGLGGGDCGFPFQRGRYYLVYATYRRSDHALEAHTCSRTQELQTAAADLTALGDPDLLASIMREEQTQLFARVGVIAACSLALVAIFVLRRRRTPLAPSGGG